MYVYYYQRSPFLLLSSRVESRNQSHFFVSNQFLEFPIFRPEDGTVPCANSNNARITSSRTESSSRRFRGIRKVPLPLNPSSLPSKLPGSDQWVRRRLLGLLKERLAASGWEEKLRAEAKENVRTQSTPSVQGLVEQISPLALGTSIPRSKPVQFRERWEC